MEDKILASIVHNMRLISRIAALIGVMLICVACSTFQVAPAATSVPPVIAPTPTAPPPALSAIPDAMTTDSTIPEPPPAPAVSWESLKNAAYPNDWPSGGVAQLADGIYREKYMPDSATEMVIQISYIRAYGDLNGDGTDDVVVVIVANPGGSGTFYYLAAVINENGRPNPVASIFLGDRVFIRSLKIEDGQTVIELDITGPNDSFCCPTDSKRFTYRLEGDSLVVTEVVDLPNPEVSARLDNSPRRVSLEPDATSISISDNIGFNRINGYIVKAQADQVMTVTASSPHSDVWLSVRGYEDGTVLASIRSEVSNWSGELPTSQEYLVNAVAVGSDTSYILRIEITGEVVPTPEPLQAEVNVDALNVRGGPGTAYDVITVIRRGESFLVTGHNEDSTWLRICCFNGQPGWISTQFASTFGNETGVPLPEDLSPPPRPSQPDDTRDKVLFLTFDDGPVDPSWTPQVLETLARHDARATFFVLGNLVKRFPRLIDSIVDAGHVVANHTYDHHTLDSISREAFFKEVLDTEEAVGEDMVKCLRPPYGATDAYTRAYATELGYEIIMWDVDTEDWRRPGADTIASRVLNNAYPGAVVLMHDGGGDRSQTIAALEEVLKELDAEGYRFDVLCRQ